jgi:hypothetical protein
MNQDLKGDHPLLLDKVLVQIELRNEVSNAIELLEFSQVDVWMYTAFSIENYSYSKFLPTVFFPPVLVFLTQGFAPVRQLEPYLKPRFYFPYSKLFFLGLRISCRVLV